MSDSERRNKVVEVAELWPQLAALEDGELGPAERDELMALLDEAQAARR